ncbi:hypothetical protein DV515_00008087 [Chloebia gouldiae]|uniref:Uncharacterized protein n=1 Tax=Chloebia gouldiae TaxID=44316 RepID=A0A3L8SF27_CHLGU|nr:hypothetical protein DV515_00008087 [Chloebia gouldiae]
MAAGGSFLAGPSLVCWVSGETGRARHARPVPSHTGQDWLSFGCTFQHSAKDQIIFSVCQNRRDALENRTVMEMLPASLKEFAQNVCLGRADTALDFLPQILPDQDALVQGRSHDLQSCVLAHQDVLMSIAHVPCSVAKQEQRKGLGRALVLSSGSEVTGIPSCMSSWVGSKIMAAAKVNTSLTPPLQKSSSFSSCSSSISAGASSVDLGAVIHCNAVTGAKSPGKRGASTEGSILLRGLGISL